MGAGGGGGRPSLGRTGSPRARKGKHVVEDDPALSDRLEADQPHSRSSGDLCEQRVVGARRGVASDVAAAAQVGGVTALRRS